MQKTRFVCSFLITTSKASLFTCLKAKARSKAVKIAPMRRCLTANLTRTNPSGNGLQKCLPHYSEQDQKPKNSIQNSIVVQINLHSVLVRLGRASKARPRITDKSNKLECQLD